MSIIIVSLIFEQLKTVLTNCLQSITLLQIKYVFTLKINPIAISIDLSLHVAMYKFVNVSLASTIFFYSTALFIYCTGG